jgi:hypothetical protein
MPSIHVQVATDDELPGVTCAHLAK